MKPSKKSKKDHPFFCVKKNCRKTAWDTPEYLDDDDWTFAKECVDILESGAGFQFYTFLWKCPTQANNFFNHIIGWPEGYNYCNDRRYTELTAVVGLRNHTLAKLKKAIEDHGSKITI